MIAEPVAGIVSQRSLHPVGETVARLKDAIIDVGATIFAVIDQSAHASRAGLSLRDTTLIIFGSPAAGTPIMAAAPLAAIDLPLKLLVWRDDGGTVWVSYLDADWLAIRHGLSAELAQPLRAAGKLARAVASP